MYYLLVVFWFCNFVITAVIPEEKDAKILIYDFENFENGTYKFSYVTSNGITRNETGEQVNVGQDNQHIAVRGSYSYIDSEGEIRLFYYTSDENGHQVYIPDSLAVRAGEGNEEYPAAVQAVSPQIASLLGG